MGNANVTQKLRKPRKTAEKVPQNETLWFRIDSGAGDNIMHRERVLYRMSEAVGLSYKALERQLSRKRGGDFPGTTLDQFAAATNTASEDWKDNTLLLLPNGTGGYAWRPALEHKPTEAAKAGKA